MLLREPQCTIAMARVAEGITTADHVLSWSASKEVAYLGGVDGGGGGRPSLIHTLTVCHGLGRVWNAVTVEQQEQRQQQTIDTTLRLSYIS